MALQKPSFLPAYRPAAGLSPLEMLPAFVANRPILFAIKAVSSPAAVRPPMADALPGILADAFLPPGFGP